MTSIKPRPLLKGEGLPDYDKITPNEITENIPLLIKDLNERVKAGAFLGTLQASYTDFHYLRSVWQKTTEKDALVGVGMTGIGSGKVLKFDLKEAAKEAKKTNEEISKIIDSSYNDIRKIKYDNNLIKEHIKKLTS